MRTNSDAFDIAKIFGGGPVREFGRDCERRCWMGEN